jgi:hypothetical protein
MGYYRRLGSWALAGDDLLASKRFSSVGRKRYGGKMCGTKEKLTSVCVQCLTIFTEPVAICTTKSLVLWYVMAGRTFTIVVINTTFSRFFDLIYRVKILNFHRVPPF